MDMNRENNNLLHVSECLLRLRLFRDEQLLYIIHMFALFRTIIALSFEETCETTFR